MVLLSGQSGFNSVVLGGGRRAHPRMTGIGDYWVKMSQGR